MQPHRWQPTRLPPFSGILQARTLEWVAIYLPSAWKWKVKVKSLSHAWLLATPWTAAYQAPSMGFSRQEYWSGLPLASLGYILGDPKSFVFLTFVSVVDFLWSPFYIAFNCGKALMAKISNEVPWILSDGQWTPRGQNWFSFIFFFPESFPSNVCYTVLIHTYPTSSLKIIWVRGRGHVYLWLIHLVCGRSQQNIIMQLSFS